MTYDQYLAKRHELNQTLSRLNNEMAALVAVDVKALDDDDLGLHRHRIREMRVEIDRTYKLVASLDAPCTLQTDN